MSQLIIDFKFLQVSYWDLLFGSLFIIAAVFLTGYNSKKIKKRKIRVSIFVTIWFATLFGISLLVIPALRETELISNKYLLVTPIRIALICLILTAYLVVNKFLINWFKRIDIGSKKSPFFLLRLLFLLITVHYSLKIILLKYDSIIKFKIFTIKSIVITVSDLIYIVLILAISAFIILLFRLVLHRQVGRKKIEESTSITLYNISKYLIWTLTIITIFQGIGFNLSVLLASSAALMVGIGLGIQQLFRDFISGIILLIERQIKVGDYVESEAITGTIVEIGFRTTIILTRDQVRVIIPNSKLVSGNVINWSKGENYSRFFVMVGVAYGSDTEKVKEIMLKCTKNHKDVLEKPEPRVQFVDFGASSLDFKVLFYTEKTIGVDFVKSDIRFEIDKEFRANDIEVPFTQMDVHFRNNLELKSNKNMSTN